jgi:hypothetical protein
LYSEVIDVRQAGHILVNSVFKELLHNLRPPILTPERVKYAYAVAIVTDILQVLMGPLGWLFADEVLDVMAMILLVRAIGFHALLLPTFILECLPIVDMLPAWTGCVAIVIGLRRRQQAGVPVPQTQEPGRIIDV